jgi:hypothetical protein
MGYVCDRPTDRGELAILDAQTPAVPSVQIESGRCVDQYAKQEH